jgi:hypothetical protein
MQGLELYYKAGNARMLLKKGAPECYIEKMISYGYNKHMRWWKYCEPS